MTGNDPKVLYLLSPSYSGSTLLTFMLAEHPQIATIGELKASWVGTVEGYSCSCGSPFLSCPFWLQVEREMSDTGGGFSLRDFGTHFVGGKRWFRRAIRAGVMGPIWRGIGDAALKVVPEWQERLETMREVNRRVMRVITRLQGGSVFLDGSKDPERLRQLDAAMGDRVFAVWLTRDGRGSANSYRKHYEVDMNEAARHWQNTTTACRRVAESFPAERVLKVRYEDVCEDPASLTEEILSFVGLPNGKQSKEGEQHILGNAMRVKGDRPIVLDEKWRRELSSDDLSAFEKVAGAMNRKLGYSA